jgi:hypothetical protein
MINGLKTNLLLICGAIACPLFIILVFIEGATRSGYDSFRYPLSSLAIGELGWTQISNFIITGILLIVFSFGIRKVFNPYYEKFKGHLLIRLVGIGLIGAGIFVTDPIFGYPSDRPLLTRQFTFHGHMHDGFSMLVFIGLPWACFSFRKRLISKDEPGWATYSTITGICMIITFILASMGFKQLPGLVDYAGALQRLCITIGWLWITLLALHLLTRDYSERLATKNNGTP